MILDTIFMSAREKLGGSVDVDVVIINVYNFELTPPPYPMSFPQHGPAVGTIKVITHQGLLVVIRYPIYDLPPLILPMKLLLMWLQSCLLYLNPPIIK